MVNSYTVLAMQDLLVKGLSALTFVKFDHSLNLHEINSHGQAVNTYIQLNMSKVDECAEPLSKGCRAWLN